MTTYLILATDILNGISKNLSIPWHIKHDLKQFKILTSTPNSCIIMGKNTWNSLPFKPLPNRTNIIISSSLQNNNLHNNTHIFNNINDAHSFAKNKFNNIWIIGGSPLYNHFIHNNTYDFILHTKIFHNFNCDNTTDLNHQNIKNNSIQCSQVMNENNLNFQYILYKNNSHPHSHNNIPLHIPTLNINTNNSVETQYFNLIEDILKYGDTRQTRNATTISIFGKSIHADLSQGFPLLTTKKVFWNGILKELLWFIHANTNSKDLETQKVNIWKGNTTQEFLQNNNLPYNQGIGGPIYGWQWRKFNQKYPYQTQTNDINTIPGDEQGTDQLQYIINEIKSNPNSRRLFMSAWNPNQMKYMCLPPCHVSYQFYIHQNKISCQMYQRSADVFLGLPFNIASTALLTHIIANICNLTPHKIIICIGDAHIYEEHTDAIHKQLQRKQLINNLPKLIIHNSHNNIDEYTENDFSIIGYHPLPTITSKMIS